MLSRMVRTQLLRRYLGLKLMGKKQRKPMKCKTNSLKRIPINLINLNALIKSRENIISEID
jgi:hypothetical protein